MDEPKRGRGRPKGTGLPPEEKRDRKTQVYSTAAEEAELHEWAAADEQGRSLSEMLLDVGLRAARRKR